MAAVQESPGADLRDYLRMVQRRKGIIILSVVVVVLTTIVASILQTKVYQGTAQLLMQPRTQETLFNPNTGQATTSAGEIQTDIQVLQSRPVRDAVTRQIGRAPNVSVSQVAQTDIVEVKAESTVPDQAAAVANAYAQAYIDFRRTQSINGLTAASSQLSGQIADLQRQVSVIDGQLNAQREAQAAAQRIQAANLQPIQPFQPDATLTAQRDALLAQQSTLKQKVDQLQVSSSLNSGGAQLVTPAVAPTTPVKPTPKRNAIIGFVVGLVFGTGLAFLFEYLDDSLRSKDDLDRASDGTPNLGLIPPIKIPKADEHPALVSIDDPHSPAAEAYRTLRTSVQFVGLNRDVRTVLVTSSSAAEGKSTTVSNLGVALARSGRWVCVVDCDLRRPRLHDFFGLSNQRGFTSAVLGEAPLAQCLQGVEGEDRLAVLASGPLPPNPAELLSSSRAGELIHALRQQFDIVVFDTPPVLPVTDAAVLSSHADAVLLVATAGTTSRREVSRAVELLRQVNAPLVGTVLNGVNSTGGYGYGKGHYYRYHGAEYRADPAAIRRPDEAPRPSDEAPRAGV